MRWDGMRCRLCAVSNKKKAEGHLSPGGAHCWVSSNA